MISLVVCFVISKKQNTRRRKHENSVRAKSDQFLNVILERSVNQQNMCTTEFSKKDDTKIQETNEKKNTKKNNQKKDTKIQIYPEFSSRSDLESIY